SLVRLNADNPIYHGVDRDSDRLFHQSRVRSPVRYRSILPAYTQRTQRHDDNNHDETIWRRGELLAEMDKNKGAREQGVGRRGKNAVASSNRVPKLSLGSRPRARPKKVGRIFGPRRWISAVPNWR